jgi:hypothetical protein
MTFERHESCRAYHRSAPNVLSHITVDAMSRTAVPFEVC